MIEHTRAAAWLLATLGTVGIVAVLLLAPMKPVHAPTPPPITPEDLERVRPMPPSVLTTHAYLTWSAAPER